MKQTWKTEVWQIKEVSSTVRVGQFLFFGLLSTFMEMQSQKIEIYCTVIVWIPWNWDQKIWEIVGIPVYSSCFHLLRWSCFLFALGPLLYFLFLIIKIEFSFHLFDYLILSDTFLCILNIFFFLFFHCRNLAYYHTYGYIISLFLNGKLLLACSTRLGAWVNRFLRECCIVLPTVNVL